MTQSLKWKSPTIYILSFQRICEVMADMFEIAKFLHDGADVDSKGAMTKLSIFSLNTA